MPDSRQIKRILYCDDYVGFEPYFIRAASRLGHEPVFVNDAARAWELIQAGEHFDLIISDYDMSEMDGLNFLKLVRDHLITKETPFVLYSANDSTELPAEVLALKGIFVSKATLFSWADLISSNLL